MIKINNADLVNKKYGTNFPVDREEDHWIVEVSDFPSQEQAWQNVLSSAIAALSNEPNSWLLSRSKDIIRMIELKSTHYPPGVHYTDDFVDESGDTKCNLPPRQEFSLSFIETLDPEKELGITFRGPNNSSLLIPNTNTLSNVRTLSFSVEKDDPDNAAAVWAKDLYPICKCNLEEALSFMMVTTNLNGVYNYHPRSDRSSTLVWDSEKEVFVPIVRVIKEQSTKSINMDTALLTLKIIHTMLADSKTLKRLRELASTENAYVKFRPRDSYGNWTSVPFYGCPYGSVGLKRVLNRWSKFTTLIAAQCIAEAKRRKDKQYNIDPPGWASKDGTTEFCKLTIKEDKTPEDIALDLLNSGAGGLSLSLYGETDSLFGPQGSPHYSSEFFNISEKVTTEFCKQAFQVSRAANTDNINVYESRQGNLNIKQAKGEVLSEWLEENKLQDNIKTLRILGNLSPLVSELESFSTLMIKWQFDDDKKIKALVDKFDEVIKLRDEWAELAKEARFTKNNETWKNVIHPIWERALHYSNMHKSYRKGLDARLTEMVKIIDSINEDR